MDSYRFRCVLAIGSHQTGGCNPLGVREPLGDLGCHQPVPGGISGYCECRPSSGKSGVGVDGTGWWRVRELSCDHPALGQYCDAACNEPVLWFPLVLAENRTETIYFGVADDASSVVSRTFARLGLTGKSVEPGSVNFEKVRKQVVSKQVDSRVASAANAIGKTKGGKEGRGEL
eukprot:SAG31_NODE_3773_length_3894_cov_3.633922_1_plen_174_part_00